MNQQRMTTKRGARGLLAAAIASVALMLAAGAAHADGAESTTTPLVGVTDTIDFVDPCTGATATVTITFNGVFHHVSRPTGTFMQVNNTAGTFALVPDDPTVPTSTGHFASVAPTAGGANGALGSVLHAEGTASDGTKVSLHFLFHHTDNGIGVTVVEFTKGCD